MSQDGLLLSSQCERQPSHLEVTEWDLYQPALDILAVVFYTFVGRQRRRRRRSEERGKTKRNSGFCLFFLPSFMRNSEQTSMDSPLADQAPTAIGYLWFPSRGMRRALMCTSIYKRTIIHTCQEILAHTDFHKFHPHTQTCKSLSYQTHKPPFSVSPSHKHTHTLQRGSGSNQIAALQSPSESCFPASLHPCTSGSSPALQ